MRDSSLLSVTRLSLLAFFESIFCGSKVAEVNRLKEENMGLREDKEILKRNYLNKVEEYNDMVQACTGDKLELLQQVRDLTSLLSSRVELPDISGYVASPVTYEAFNEPLPIPLGIIADEYYYTFTLPQWRDILTEVQRTTKDVLEQWKPNISDCDDFALVLNGFAVTAFVKAGLDYQGALLFARSRSHAYNVFVAYGDDGFTAYVYEPQNNRVVGKLVEVDYEPYVTIKGWLLGAELPPF